MADTRNEGDTRAMSIGEFIAHLRSEDPKTVIDDQRSADEIEQLRDAITAADKVIAEKEGVSLCYYLERFGGMDREIETIRSIVGDDLTM